MRANHCRAQKQIKSRIKQIQHGKRACSGTVFELPTGTYEEPPEGMSSDPFARAVLHALGDRGQLISQGSSSSADIIYRLCSEFPLAVKHVLSNEEAWR